LEVLADKHSLIIDASSSLSEQSAGIARFAFGATSVAGIMSCSGVATVVGSL